MCFFKIIIMNDLLIKMAMIANPNQIKFYNEDGKLAENDISVKTFKQKLRERQQKK